MSSVLKTRVYRGADIDSDHSLVVSDVRLKLKAPVRKKIERKFNAEKLLSEDAEATKFALEVFIGGSFNELSTEPSDTEHEWAKFKEATTQAAEQVLGFAPHKKT